MEKVAWFFEGSIGNARKGLSEEQLPTGYTQNCYFPFFPVYTDIKPLPEHLNTALLLLPPKSNNRFAQEKYPNP